MLGGDPIDCGDPRDPRTPSEHDSLSPLNMEYLTPKIDHSLSPQTHILGDIFEFVPGQLYELHGDSLFNDPLDSIALQKCWTDEITGAEYCRYNQYYCGVIVDGGTVTEGFLDCSDYFMQNNLVNTNSVECDFTCDPSTVSNYLISQNISFDSLDIDVVYHDFDELDIVDGNSIDENCESRLEVVFRVAVGDSLFFFDANECTLEKVVNLNANAFSPARVDYLGIGTVDVTIDDAIENNMRVLVADGYEPGIESILTRDLRLIADFFPNQLIPEGDLIRAAINQDNIFVQANNGSTYEDMTTVLTIAEDDPKWDFSGIDRSTVSAHSSMQNAWDYFMTTFDDLGSDGEGTPIFVLTNSDTENAKSLQPDREDQYFDIHVYGRKVEFPFVWTTATPEVAAHEFTHSIIFRHLEGLQLNNEFFESYGDIFGIMADRYFRAENNLPLGDFQFGNGFVFRRSLSNPQQFGDPAHLTQRIANGDPHDNCGIQNKFFFLLSKGGSGVIPDHDITVLGIGEDKASEVLWRVLQNHLTDIPSYQGMRDAAILEAIALYGECSFERAQVQNAWAGVGVGEPFDDIQIHGNKTFCVDNTNWYRWTLCSGLPGDFNWSYPQLWDVALGPDGVSFEVLNFNGLEGTPPWVHTITATNIQTGISESFTLRIKDCFNNYPPHPCEQNQATEIRSSTSASQQRDILTLFPNPTSDMLTYHITNDSPVQSVEIISAVGNERHRLTNRTTLNLQQHLSSSGLFILLVKLEDGQSYSKKFYFEK